MGQCMSKDAWKDTGNCRECRKRDYCKTRCRAAELAIEREVTGAITRFMAEKMTKGNGNEDQFCK